MTTFMKKMLARATMLMGMIALLPTGLMAQSDTLRLTLDEALRIAHEHSTALRSAQLDTEKMQTDRRVNLAQLFPKIDATGSYGYTLKKQRVYFGGEGSSNPMAAMMPAEGIEMGQTHNIQAGVSAQLPLIAPQLWASLGIDRASVEIALEKARASSVNLTAEIRKAYMGVLLATDSHRVLTQSLANMRNNYDNIKQKYDRGLVAEYDLIRMDAQVKNLIPEVIRAEQSVRLAGMRLLVLMGLEPTTPVSLGETLSQYTDKVYGNILGGQSEQSYNLEQNTTLRNIDLMGTQLEAVLRTKRMAFMPTLGLSFSYIYNYASDKLQLSNDKRWSPFSNIGLGLTIPLFAGGSRINGVKATKLQIDQLALQRRQAERELRLGLSNAISEQRNASAQFVASQDAVRSAEKGLKIAEVRYRSGSSSVLEYNDAELALRQAQLNLNQSIYNYMLSTFSLEQLEGKSFNPSK